MLPENKNNFERVFHGLRTCLQASDDEEAVLMKTNQILYDTMPDILKHDLLQSEVQKLIPCLIENLGNSKVSHSFHTHLELRMMMCIGARAQINPQGDWNIREAL